MNIIKNCHDLYWQVDFFLLPCVLEIVRKKPKKYLQLDPTYHLSTHGYSWDAMLRFADVNLKLISDIEKYNFNESKIRVDISIICEDLAEANNIFLKSYDANNPTSNIRCLDGNDLYGHSILKYMIRLNQKILI